MLLEARGGGVLYIFWVRGPAIGMGIDFHDFGIRNGIDFHDFGRRNGINFRHFHNLYRVGYAFSENWYKVGYIFLKDWYKVGYTFWKNWYKEPVCFWNLDGTSPSKSWSSTPPPRGSSFGRLYEPQLCNIILLASKVLIKPQNPSVWKILCTFQKEWCTPPLCIEDKRIIAPGGGTWPKLVRGCAHEKKFFHPAPEILLSNDTPF